MKIFSASQIKACDAYTIHASGISSAELMERAAIRCADWIQEHYSKETLFVLLCGRGNNGGDGLALTRLLHERGFGVKAFLIDGAQDLSNDCAWNADRLRALDGGLLASVAEDSFLTDIPLHVVLVDALFGTGLHRPLEGWLADFVLHLNHLPNEKLAIDIPSGMPADTVPPPDTVIVKASHTLSFQFYKRSFLHVETGVYTGHVHILDIGLDDTFIQATHSSYQIIDAPLIKSLYRSREDFSHKGSLGTALLIGGSRGMIGAIALSTLAAARSGAGKVGSLVPECGYTIMQTLVPEAMCQTNGNDFLQQIEGWEHADAVGIGPGLGTHPATAIALEEFLEQAREPLIVDADALNIMAIHKHLLDKLPAHSILTPHPGEYSRLFGAAKNSMLQVEHARTQAMRYNIVIVLKGHYTAVVTPDGGCWYNINGNSGLASGGSGDALTGILAGLLAQHYEPWEAALLGVYLHGSAADLALNAESKESMLAGDVIKCLGKAFDGIGY